MHEHIGRHLKAMFDHVVTQPVPDKLRDLLEQLEKDKPRKKGRASEKDGPTD
jgi:hypothetical protein